MPEVAIGDDSISTVAPGTAPVADAIGLPFGSWSVIVPIRLEPVVKACDSVWPATRFNV